MATIFELVDTSDVDGIRALLAADPTARERRNDEGLSPLMHAAYRGRRPVFEAILEAGEPTDSWDRLIGGYADDLPAPDAWSPDGFTPLHLAAFVDNVPAATALLDAGADPDVLATASFARVTPLGTCAFSGALGVARVLLEHGADPHIGEAGEYTVEAEAVARGNSELARLIEAAGAGWKEAAR
ncbi:MAG TPA: ankyrin repeat domain-containing protein [Gaiellaceae bacterium]